jgi:energy-coupling factor transporter ATP-binding protein EcfA2
LHNRFWNECHGRAALVGPHGAGKSTLLEHLVPRLGPVVVKQQIGLDPSDPRQLAEALATPAPAVVWLTLRGRRESARAVHSVLRQWRSPRGVLVLDGYEQLSRLSRAACVCHTRLRGQRLLVTSHRATCLPTLAHLEVSVDVALQLLGHLLAAQTDGDPVADGKPVDTQHADTQQAGFGPLVHSDRRLELEELLRQHAGNLREVFMELYDRAQAAARRTPR